MLDKLVDIALAFGQNLIPCTVVDHYEKGVMLRFGKFRKVCEPGFHWKAPFIDKVLTQTVVPTTMNLGSQSLTTLDGKTVVVAAVVKYKITDIETLLLEVYDAVDAIGDMTQAIIKECVMQKNWADLQGTEIDDLITEKSKKEAKKWGLGIIRVTLTDVGIIRSIRLFNSTSLS